MTPHRTQSLLLYQAEATLTHRVLCPLLFQVIAFVLAVSFRCPAEEPSAPPEPAPAHLELAKTLFAPGIADGFDFPAGNSEGTGTYVSKTTRKKYAGWKVTGKPGEPDGDQPHTGEAWNGSGGGATDEGQPVFAIAAGTVSEIKDSPRGPAVIIEHRFVENGALHTVWSVSAGLADITLKAGDTVKRRQPLGVIGNRGDGTLVQLYLEIRTKPAAEDDPVKGCEPPSEFIRAHGKVMVPAQGEEPHHRLQEGLSAALLQSRQGDGGPSHRP